MLHKSTSALIIVEGIGTSTGVHIWRRTQNEPWKHFLSSGFLDLTSVTFSTFQMSEQRKSPEDLPPSEASSIGVGDVTLDQSVEIRARTKYVQARGLTDAEFVC